MAKNPEAAVRAAALAFHEALVAAASAGLAVNWPRRPEDLPSLEVSETRAVVTEPAPKAAPVAEKPAAPAKPAKA